MVLCPNPDFQFEASVHGHQTFPEHAIIPQALYLLQIVRMHTLVHNTVRKFLKGSLLQSLQHRIVDMMHQIHMILVQTDSRQKNGGFRKGRQHLTLSAIFLLNICQQRICRSHLLLMKQLRFRKGSRLYVRFFFHTPSDKIMIGAVINCNSAAAAQIAQFSPKPIVIQDHLHQLRLIQIACAQLQFLPEHLYPPVLAVHTSDLVRRRLHPVADPKQVDHKPRGRRRMVEIRRVAALSVIGFMMPKRNITQLRVEIQLFEHLIAFSGMLPQKLHFLRLQPPVLQKNQLEVI